ncbi:sigma-70 family RNA polymerase sigma factor [Prauserella alba]|uniref:RNA polymerase sigma factor, sigma-70 family n=1 Tax=Prauserella alba TaxID=176898 RepID=A0ABP4G6E7_9PSEU|nr:sigma-70 family RNA polymerase sigma factor [Prauserella alba]MCP2181993.1 RNA polymerase sigma factor, sigma-70 family [Prauserella alba]
MSATDEAMLLERLRQGEDDAFGELFELHVASVRRLARGIARDGSEAEDITAETFFRVLQAVRRGNGPKDNVRAYLLTVARRVTWEWQGARRDVPVSDDELTTRVGAGADTQSSTAEASLITRAFSSLPERWRTVLWQTEVEGVQPANVAPEFGLSPNATAALARRARIGLRAAYLQAHLATGRSDNGCRTIVEKLGGYTAGSVTGAEARKVKTHLAACSSCRATHDELRDVCSSLRSHAGVLVLLVPAAGIVANWGGAGAVSGAVSSVAGSAGAGSTAGAASGAAGGLAALSGHVKVGLAVASTVAVGAAGVAGVAGLPEGDERQVVGLHGGPRGGLQLVEPAPAVPEVDRMADRDGADRDGAEGDRAERDGADGDGPAVGNGRSGGAAVDEHAPMGDTDYSVPAAASDPGDSAQARRSARSGARGDHEREPQPRHGTQADDGASGGNGAPADAARADAGANNADRDRGGTARSGLGVKAGTDRNSADRNSADRNRAAKDRRKSVFDGGAPVAKRLAQAWAEKVRESRRDRGVGFGRPTERPGARSAADPAPRADHGNTDSGNTDHGGDRSRADRDGDDRARGFDHRLPRSEPDHQGRKPAAAHFRGQ